MKSIDEQIEEAIRTNARLKILIKMIKESTSWSQEVQLFVNKFAEENSK